jgi:hypothetical protein
METTMPSYTAEFRTDADYATRAFKARSPRHALMKARAFYDKRGELMFESYVWGHPVNEIAVRDAEDSEVALWQGDELRLRLAAGEMLEALELCVDCLADLARLDDGTPSISALEQARAAIARAKPETVPAAVIRGTARPLPPDPEKMNGDRTEGAAAAALRQYQCATGCDYEDSLGDLLCDLMHWGDRHNFDFEAALCRARGHYEAETAGAPS